MFQGGEGERVSVADAENLMSPSLPQSFEFHARTDLVHRFAREKSPFVEKSFTLSEVVALR